MVADDLVWLLNQLRNAPRPVDRLRLLARGWRTLHDLSKADRLRVAHELGIAGADRLVEQMAHRGGASPAVLLAALERLHDAGPDRVGELVRRLVDPEQRGELAGEVLDEVAAQVLGPPPERAADDGGAGHAAPVDEALPLPPPPAVGRGAGPEPAPPTPAAPASGSAAAADTVPSTPAAVPARGRRVVGGRTTAEEPVRPPATASRRRATPRREPAAVAEAAVPRPSVADVVAALRAARSLLRRLRLLAGAVPRVAAAGSDGLDAVLEAFPDGWARRRAVETLLRAGLPARLEDALELVRSLPAGAQRLWALTTLVASRPLSGPERELVLGAAGSPLLARRLRLRLGL